MIDYKTILDELPKERKGRLSDKVHSFTGVQIHDDDCGSHGCTGHTYRRLVCSCGYVASLSDVSESEQLAIRNHRAAVVDKHLGLRFIW